jgi:hypothetical protein
MLQTRFTKLLGAFLVIEGVWGWFSPVMFGVLTTNFFHATIHIVLGALGLWASGNGRSRSYLLLVGGLLLVVGVLRFVPGGADIVISVLNVNRAVGLLNIAVGVACLAVALAAPRRRELAL